MTTCLLQGRRFFCREWAFSKITHYLDSRSTSNTCGALMMGGPGCGKTAVCAEMTWPTGQGRQQALSKRILAYHFCQAHDIETLSLTNFILSLVDQISKSDLIEGYRDVISEPDVKAALKRETCEVNPDDAFKKGVLDPLLSIPPPSQNVFILVDSIDESYLQSINDTGTGSKTIAELLANHHQLFPTWLMLICSARKQSKSVTRLFTGFRKISLDDLRKSHVVRDVQQYILCRLDQEQGLRQHLSRETAEMLNQLHIKSNGCFLYLEKVLDGVAESFIMLREIREIPGTLNGLYLWLCQRLFVKKQFQKVQPILNVILAARSPLTEEELFRSVWTGNTTLNVDEFHSRMEALSKIIFSGQEGTKILFHHSFAEWLLDVKHCTQKYLCNAAEGHGMLAMNLTLTAPHLSPEEVHNLALHLSKAHLVAPTEGFHLPLWLIQSGAPVETSLMAGGLPKEQQVTKLLLEAGAELPKSAEESTSATLEKIEKQEKKKSESLKELVENGVGINEVDATGRPLLCAAAHQGNIAMVQLLISRGADLEAMDKTGQTALNLAARQGHSEIVSILIKAQANGDHTDTEGWTPLRSAAWGGHTEVVGLLLIAGAQVDLADSENRTALRAAAWGGHEDIVLKLLEYGADVNKVDNEGRTALIAASYMGHTEIVQHLLEHGANLNQEDCDGRTALSVAALCIPASQGGLHASVVSLLLDYGAEVDHQDKDGMTPVLVAAYEGHHEVCELLLENDADVDHTDNNGRTPLLAAASMGHAKVVSLLLFFGAAIDTIDPEGRTVLSIACAQGNVEVVQELLDRGLDELHRDNAGLTPLHMAAFEGHKEVCEALIEHGSKVNETDNEGRIPLIVAAQEGHLECVRVLLAAGSLLDHRSHDGKNAFRVAAMEGHKEVTELLIQEGTDMNYCDADGRSTLYLVALENNLVITNALLKGGADPEIADFEGRTPLHVASWQGHHEICEALLNWGANVNSVDNDCRTPLQSASWQGHFSIVKLILEFGADVEHTCNQGATSLCIAAQEGHDEIVRLLLQYGANANHADQCGRTPMRVAMKGNHQGVCKLLEEYGAFPYNSNTLNSTSTSSCDTKTSSGPAVTSIAPISNGYHATASPTESPVSTLDKRKSCMSNNSSKSSSNLTSSNSSTNQSCNSVPCDSQGMTFTQQLQQASTGRGRNRLSRVLSPVSEPQSPTQSPGGSPVSEAPSMIILPDSNIDRKPPELPPKQNKKKLISPKKEIKRLLGSPNKEKGEKDRKKSVSAVRVDIPRNFNIISNPHAELFNANDEPVWQPLPAHLAKIHSQQQKASLPAVTAKHVSANTTKTTTDQPSPKIALGLRSLSPEMRRKRISNGMVSNQSFNTKTNGNANNVGTRNGQSDNTTNDNNIANGNGMMDNQQLVLKQKLKLEYEGPVRPNGLPLKKETPL
ncbi:ankyrin repeat domain-containing protein 50 [Lingula anatina]|uniref:Ankyrin repeat domain-containing protein 50 n=1 Tax=Lingula anatina TaxID=7574 RepID=A0A1S3H8J0_LINAN|nr:ankyrin repeat domain-containing protein 50 [Lingula anatina]XP_013382302.1 ankyrin repeat domain-containing protein 50 [Lingula anatina]XP_013382303.1 ankyrin repeat domain-containing protein 50 [Lingula anatina]XP_013382304.1 ankyrin repeat domain-containing protein 50 [Lingula anatina]XP_013382307.1 ankyrin repeat domain-containing protein 50 [Lingula anatina]XP_013382308.1 ankyrin repeat domain-containing protein 50 [Lingula anatina]|eukprot:XP_013382301.1 ankyrin repeat domain-containing protein 50 [Lingula anatina]